MAELTRAAWPLLAAAMTSASSAQQGAAFVDPVVAHFREYRAALERNDLETAEAAAAVDDEVPGEAVDQQALDDAEANAAEETAEVEASAEAEAAAEAEEPAAEEAPASDEESK